MLNGGLDPRGNHASVLQYSSIYLTNVNFVEGKHSKIHLILLNNSFSVTVLFVNLIPSYLTFWVLTDHSYRKYFWLLIHNILFCKTQIMW